MLSNAIRNNETRVIPVILRYVYWDESPFAHLKCLPSNKTPVTGWNNQDEALYDVTIGIRRVIEDLREHSSVAFSVRRSRQNLIRYQRDYLREGILEESLHHATPISLRLHKQPDALQKTERPSEPLPAGTRITQIYDKDNKLLILGRSGAGKTTLLLALARDLLNRAEQNEGDSIPIFLNLSSWARKHLPLTEWLIEELQSKYNISLEVSRKWIDNNRVILLLDGLDEMNLDDMQRCIEIINTYCDEHKSVSIVVCSQSDKYGSLKTRIKLWNAVTVQPLTVEQIDAYLKNSDKQLEALRLALHDDSELQEMFTTPLMLSILVQAYQGKPVEDLIGAGSPEEQRQHVLTVYVKHILERGGVQTDYKKQEKTIHWLAWLAGQMKQHHQTVFNFKQVQSDWLPNGYPQHVYNRITNPMSGLFKLFRRVAAPVLVLALCVIVALPFVQTIPIIFKWIIGIPLVLGFLFMTVKFAITAKIVEAVTFLCISIALITGLLVGPVTDLNMISTSNGLAAFLLNLPLEAL